jgi:elongation factor G
VPELKAGDLGAVAKLKDTHTSDVLADKQVKYRVAAIKFPEPVLAYAIEPKSRGDEDKISSAMQRLREEDPSISYARDPQTHELLLSGQGQLHIEVTVAKLKRRFGVEVNLKPPRIPYPGDDHRRDRSARAPQEADRRPRPVRRLQDQGRAHCRGAATFQFEDDIFGGAIPRQFVPGRGKGHPGCARARLPGRLPDGRFQSDGVRRLLSRRRLQRVVVQDGRNACLQGRDDPRPARPFSSR